MMHFFRAPIEISTKMDQSIFKKTQNQDRNLSFMFSEKMLKNLKCVKNERNKKDTITAGFNLSKHGIKKKKWSLGNTKRKCNKFKND